MFKHAILSSHSLGQKIKGVDKSPSILSKYLKMIFQKLTLNVVIIYLKIYQIFIKPIWR